VRFQGEKRIPPPFFDSIPVDPMTNSKKGGVRSNLLVPPTENCAFFQGEKKNTCLTTGVWQFSRMYSYPRQTRQRLQSQAARTLAANILELLVAISDREVDKAWKLHRNR
jgi:hypothetical protein